MGLWNASFFGKRFACPDHPWCSLQLCFCSLFNRFMWVSRLAGHRSFAGRGLSIRSFGLDDWMQILSAENVLVLLMELCSGTLAFCRPTKMVAE